MREGGGAGGGGGEKVRHGGMGATDSATAAQHAGAFSSTHLFGGIIHLKRDGGGGGEGEPAGLHHNTQHVIPSR